MKVVYSQQAHHCSKVHLTGLVLEECNKHLFVVVHYDAATAVDKAVGVVGSLGLEILEGYLGGTHVVGSPVAFACHTVCHSHCRLGSIHQPLAFLHSVELHCRGSPVQSYTRAVRGHLHVPIDGLQVTKL